MNVERFEVVNIEKQAVLEGKKNAIERAEAGNENQNRNVGTVDQQTANVNDHCQITNNLFSGPEVAVGNIDAKCKADQCK